MQPLPITGIKMGGRRTGFALPALKCNFILKYDSAHLLISTFSRVKFGSFQMRCSLKIERL
jgi:hypothetical protein